MPYKREYHKIICPRCGREYEVLTPAYKRKQKDPKYGAYCTSCRAKVLWEEMSDEEKTNMKKKSAESNSKRYKSMSEAQRKEMVEKRRIGVKMHWASLSESERKRISEKRSKDRKNYLNNLSDEEMKIIGEKISRSKLEINSNMSDEEKAARKLAKQEERQRYWESLSDEDKDRIKHQLIHNANLFWKSLSDDEKNIMIKPMHDGYRKWRDNMSNEERLIWSEMRSKSAKEHWESLSDEQKEIIRNKRIEEWNRLSDYEKAELINRRLSKSNVNGNGNSFHNRFERSFSESYISTLYSLRPEITLSNETIHTWDYGIYSKDSNELVMVVDLDGSYFHADNCDYDGIHSREEYDEKRSLSVPEGIKISIIQELNFSKSFEKIIKDLITKDYDEYINQIFTECRSMSFPYPKYSDVELMKSYNRLQKMNCNDKYHKDISLNTRVGDRLIQHFHPSIYHAHVNGKPSPYEAWSNDKLLKRVIQNRIIYQNYLNPSKILQGFNVSKTAPKVSVFSASRAKILISKYLSDYDTIFDPFSGFSGRMLGTISLGKKYIGQDVSDIHVRESNNMIEFLRDNGINVDATVTQADILQSSGEYPCLFTCPPYGLKEVWQGEITDSRSCDDWIDICINNFKCSRYLFVVDNTERYKDYMVDIIINKSHFGLNKEYVIMIDREGD